MDINALKYAVHISVSVVRPEDYGREARLLWKDIARA